MERELCDKGKNRNATALRVGQCDTMTPGSNIQENTIGEYGLEKCVQPFGNSTSFVDTTAESNRVL